MNAIAELEHELRTVTGPNFTRADLEAALRSVGSGNLNRDDFRLQGEVYMLSLPGTLQTVLWTADELDAPAKARELAVIIRRAIQDLRRAERHLATVFDLTKADVRAGARLLTGVCSRVGYQVPCYMASDLRREMKCSMETVEKFFEEVAFERDIEEVTYGAHPPRGQLLIILWPVERDGKSVLTPRLYELPWLMPSPDTRAMCRDLSARVH